MKLTTKLLKKLIKEELNKMNEAGASDFHGTAARVGNELQGVGFGLRRGEGERQIEHYIIGVLENPDRDVKMPGKYSDKTYNHGDVADIIRALMPDYKIGDMHQYSGDANSRRKIKALASEIMKNIKSRHED